MNVDQLNKIKSEIEEIELPDPKPGVKTTEFYIAVAAQVIALLVLLGVISSADASAINGWLVEAVEKGGAFLLSGVTAWAYIKARAAVKGG